MQHTATHYNTLQHTATPCNTENKILEVRHVGAHYNRDTAHNTAMNHNALQHKPTHCNRQTQILDARHAGAHCNPLQHIATHCKTEAQILMRGIGNAVLEKCSTLQDCATHYNTLQSSAMHCNTLQSTDPDPGCETCRHSDWQLTATRCNALQRAATHCNTNPDPGFEECRRSLQYAVIRCNTLQHTATHCTTPQYAAIHRPRYWMQGMKALVQTTARVAITRMWHLLHKRPPSSPSAPLIMSLLLYTRTRTFLYV